MSLPNFRKFGKFGTEVFNIPAGAVGKEIPRSRNVKGTRSNMDGF